MRDFSIAAMTPADWPEVRRIYQQGIDTGDATFETAAPDWEHFDAVGAALGPSAAAWPG